MAAAYSIETFDLSTKAGRRKARLAGHAVPAAKSGRPFADFWSFVRKSDDCWEWTGSTSGGYGQFRGHNRAHRSSWVEANGPIPDGLVVCHRCDNRLCVRPDHLFLGTVEDNVRDRVTKNRSARGERVNTAKLTREQVERIRAVAVKGTSYGRTAHSYTALAREYGVTVGAISLIVKGKNWR